MLTLLPVQVHNESQEPAVETSAAMCAAPPLERHIEITLLDGVRIAISCAVPAEQLGQVLAVLRG